MMSVTPPVVVLLLFINQILNCDAFSLHFFFFLFLIGVIAVASEFLFILLLLKNFLIHMWSVIGTKVAEFVWPNFLAVFRNKCAYIGYHILALRWGWGKQLINHIWIIDISDIALQGLPSLIYIRGLFFMGLLEYLSLNNVFTTKPQTQSQYFF